MTETYAATIATIAPVLWLVAAVEVHQYTRHFEGLQGSRQLVAQARRYAERIEGPTTDEQLEELDEFVSQSTSSALDALSPPEVRRRIAWAYLLLVGLLLGAEAVSLLWLGGAQAAAPGWAWFCLIAVLLGFLAVTTLPVIGSAGVISEALKGRADDMDWLGSFLDRQASIRQEARDTEHS
ncbi:hypothetical protein [Streptomyces phaeochromogenes]|uniref:hypothetical protein n=1 Tax=Streptomyces phaeochromogenes TaxID=1923 RepID=UPI00371BF6E3